MLIKKITALAASAALVFGTLCFSANAATPEEDFIIIDNCITDYVGNGGDIVIPDGITRISSFVFWKNDNITSVVIPKSCTVIGTSAFMLCHALKSVTFEGDINSIGTGTFTACMALESVTFNSSFIENVGDDAFWGCENLKTVEFAPDSRVNVIGKGAFMNCANLSEVKLPNKVGNIYTRAFTNCPELTCLEIPSMTEFEEFSVGYMLDQTTLVAEYVKADGKATVQAQMTFPDDNGVLVEVCQKPITLVVAPNSPAEKYAKENDIAYEYKTVTDSNSPAEENPQTGGNDLLPICFSAVFSLPLILFINKKTT